MQKFPIQTAMMAAAVAAMPAAAVSQGVAGQPMIPAGGPLISFSVTENVETAPDVATISTGVQTRALTAKEAMRLNAVSMDRVIAAILKSGIERKDIQTSGLSLSPQYDYSNQKPGEGPRFIGYDASNQLTVKVRKIADAGDIVDRMVQAGATNIGGPSFGISDDAALMRKAREKAVKSAMERANFYAMATGYRTARLISLSENGEGPRPYPVPMMVRAMAADAAPETKVEPGQISTGITVNVQFVLEK